MKEIKCSGILTQKESVEAENTIFRLSEKPFLIILIFIAIIAFIGLCITLFVRQFPILAAELQGGRSVNLTKFSATRFIVPLAFVTFTILCYFWLSRRNRKAFQDRFPDQTVSYILSEEFFVAEEKYSVVKVPWQDFIYWRETANILLFHFDKHQAAIIPKRLISEAEKEQIKTWISQAQVVKK